MITFVRISLTIVTLFLYGWSIAIYGNTIANIYILLVGAIATAAALWLPCSKIWKRILPSAKPAVRFVAHTAATTSLTLFAILALNYYCAEPDTTHTVNAFVESRYSKERQRTRRIRRHVYGTGGTYHVYYIRLRFDDSRTKERQISLRQYNSTHKGDTLKMSVSRGLLGLPVISADKHKFLQ